MKKLLILTNNTFQKCQIPWFYRYEPLNSTQLALALQLDEVFLVLRERSLIYATLSSVSIQIKQTHGSKIVNEGDILFL